MNWCSALLIGFLAAPPSTAEPQVELRVVGVFRPVDLEGRTVAAEREVFLEAIEEDADVSKLVGTVLEVTRTEAIPVKTARHSGLPMLDLSDSVESGHEQPIWKIGEDHDQQPGSIVMRGMLDSLDSSDHLESLGNGRPAAFASRSESAASAATLVLGGVEERTASEEGQTPTIDDRPKRKTRIGELRVTEVRGSIVVAEVVEDGLASRPGVVGALSVTIMSGDRARGKPRPKVTVKRQSKSNKAMAQKLEAERKSLERDLIRRNRKPKPFRRRVMKWDL